LRGVSRHRPALACPTAGPAPVADGRAACFPTVKQPTPGRPHNKTKARRRRDGPVSPPARKAGCCGVL